MKINIARHFSNAKLNQKIQVVYIGIIIGYSVLFLGFWFLFYSKELKNYALENDKSLVQTTIKAMLSESKNVNNITKAISSDEYIKQYLRAESQEMESKKRIALNNMYQYIYLLDYISSIYVVRLDRDYINVETNQTKVNLDCLRSDAWGDELEAVEGSAVYRKNGNNAFIRFSGDNTVSFMRAIYDFNNLELIGYLSVNMNMDFFQNSCRELLEAEGVGIAIWDENEQIVQLGQEMFFTLTEENKHGYSGICRNRGLDYSLYCSEISDWDLYFLLEKEISLSGLEKEVFLAFIVITFLFSILSWSALHWIVVSKITNPIAKLVDSMERVKEGWLYRVSLKTDNDEIGMLKDSYNMMLVEMNKLITELVDKEKKQRKLELDILQEQIKPHFLYNTLYRIENIAMENQDTEVMESLQTLGDFYRKFLSKGEKSICLKEEIGIVRDYLKLQCLRYADVFTFEINMEKNIGEYMVPKLILQPLVENSIYHGVRLKGEEGLISVEAWKSNGRIWIRVYDNGIGMSEEKLNEIMQENSGKSFGLKATIERLQYFYNIEDVYEINSVEDEFMEVILKLPICERGQIDE